MQDFYPKILEYFLSQLEDDYTCLFYIANSLLVNLKLNGKKLTPEEAQTYWWATCKIVTMFLQKGVLAVELADHGKCTPWQDQTPEGVMNEIKRRYIKEKDDIGRAQFSVWFYQPHKTPSAEVDKV